MQQKYTVVDHLLTIPEAQTRIFDLEWQSTFYTVFHQTRTSRLLHALCMAPICFSLFLLATYWDLGTGSLFRTLPELTAINGSIIILMICSIWYIAMDRTVGFATMPVILGFWLLANGTHYLMGMSGVWFGLALLFGASAIQTISHQPEQVPPPHSGTDKFMSFPEWQQKASFWHKFKVSVMFPIFTMVELISSPRLMPVQILRLMHKFGYRKDMEARNNLRARRVLETGNYDAYWEV